MFISVKIYLIQIRKHLTEIIKIQTKEKRSNDQIRNLCQIASYNKDVFARKKKKKKRGKQELSVKST